MVHRSGLLFFVVTNSGDIIFSRFASTPILMLQRIESNHFRPSQGGIHSITEDAFSTIAQVRLKG
jgi:hypothetical protein